MTGERQRRSRWRFGLRTLLIAVVLLQFPLVWYFYARARADAEELAVTTILGEFGRGGFSRDALVFDITSETWQLERRSSFRKYLADQALDRYVYPVAELSGRGCRLDSSLDPSFATLSGLQRLTLHSPYVEDDFTLPSSRLSNLRVVSLSNSHVPPKLLQSIADCANVAYLGLDQCDIDAESLSTLASIRGLKQLNLSHCTLASNNRADPDLAVLRSLTSLDVLNIDGISGVHINFFDLPPYIQSLSANDCDLSYKKPFATYDNLVVMEMSGTNTTVDDLSLIMQHAPRLKGIALRNTSVKKSDARSLTEKYPHTRVATD